MNIITITLNPAFDIHCAMNEFRPEHENYVSACSRIAGGKGVNISRALTVSGVGNRAIVVLGRENSAEFEAELAADKMNYEPIYISGRIRENITLHPKNAPETRISFEGAKTDGAVLDRVFENISRELSGSAIVTFTGRIPAGLDKNRVALFLEKIIKAGARLVLDSNSFSLEDIISISPWLIKPNSDELSVLLKAAVKTPEEAVKAAHALSEKGIENVMISLGAAGAVLASASAGAAYACSAPKIKAISTIGAGDSSLAGFCAAYFGGKPLDGCLAEAVAWGSAACMREGTLPPLPEDINILKESIKIKSVSL